MTWKNLDYRELSDTELVKFLEQKEITSSTVKRKGVFFYFTVFFFLLFFLKIISPLSFIYYFSMIASQPNESVVALTNNKGENSTNTITL